MCELGKSCRKQNFDKRVESKRECLKVAIESDPNYSEAFTKYAEQLAWCYSLFQTCDFSVLTEAFRIINKSLSLTLTLLRIELRLTYIFIKKIGIVCMRQLKKHLNLVQTVHQ